MPNRSVAEFAKSAISCMYDLEIVNITKNLALPSVVAEIEGLLKLNEVQTLNQRHQHFNISDTTIHDYEECFYELGAGKTIFAGIRHINGSKDQPFVHTLLDFTPRSSEIKLLKEFAAKQFQKFSPKFVSVWLKPSLQASALEGNIISSRQYVAASLSQLRNRERPSGYERITLKKVDKDLDFKWYTNAYEDFHNRHPELKDWVPMTDEEDINRCILDGLLYEVFVDGHLSGLIGAQNESLLGLPAVYMTELLLISSFKGQGLAVAMQRRFLDELPNQFHLVWGTIDAKNLPSMKTALRVGRAPIRSEYFFKLL